MFGRCTQRLRQERGLRMKFALIYQVQLPKPWTDRGEYQLFQNILAQVSFAEEMGFESVWFMEHHFAPEQSHSSAPDMILAAQAAAEASPTSVGGV